MIFQESDVDIFYNGLTSPLSRRFALTPFPSPGGAAAFEPPFGRGRGGVPETERRKNMKWFRLYSECLDDPKVQRLSPALFKHWVNLLCLASESAERGRLPALRDIAFRLRLKPGQAAAVLEELAGAGLLDRREEDGHFSPHNWHERQRNADDVAARVRRHRAASGTQEHRAAHAPFEKTGADVTLPILTEEREKEKEKKTEAETDSEPSEVQAAKELLRAFRKARYPDCVDFRESDWMQFEPTLRALARDGRTPEDIKRATQMALRRFTVPQMVNIGSVARSIDSLLEADANVFKRPQPRPSTRRLEEVAAEIERDILARRAAARAAEGHFHAA